MSIKVDATAAIKGLSGIGQQIPPVSIAARKKAAQSGVEGAKGKVHVVTGRLKNSIRIISETPEATTFGSDLDYAGHEEFRGGANGPHSYLMPEFKRLQTQYPDFIMTELRRIF
jgi:phage gpG-like protein